jgi:quercetin dioxygenase-like cupin family protein
MYVREGALLVDIDAQMVEVGAGEVVHIPEGMVHSYVVISLQDAVLIIAECVGEEGGASLQALAGMEDGGRDVGVQYRVSQSPRASGGDVRYVYRWDELDRVPEHQCSAKVTPRAHVSKKSSSYGAALSGDKIHVGLIRKPRGSGAKLHTHPNEQFNIVLEGALEAEIDGQSVRVPSHHVIHMPAGVVHSTVASAEGDVMFFVAKDTRHGLAGPPVDGIEDGPRYLAGFKPQN